MSARIAVALSMVTACGSGTEAPAARPMSAAAHEAAAQRHDEEAEAHEELYQPELENRSGQPVQCLDRPLAGVSYSGTEPLQIMRPCWSADRNPTAHHLQEASVHREEASRHRGEARALLHTEARACAGLGEKEIAHSPFFHYQDVLRVEPYREGGELRGARVVFREVPGLSRAWLGRAIACHQARAAVMGYSRTFMSYCPITAGPIAASVERSEEGIVVILRSDRSEIAAAVLGRAQDLTGRREEGR